MTKINLYEKLFTRGHISAESYKKIKASDNGLFAIGSELKLLLYAGVLMLAGGLGIAIYNNIDSIGHLAIICLIAVVSASCFYYCYRKSLPYSNAKVNSPNVFFDYILLLGGLTLISFTGYVQYQYVIFGPYDGLAILVPSILLFAAAYYFDHLGILSMAITTFAGFAGISLAPATFFSDNIINEELIFTGILIGFILVLAGGVLSVKSIKQHFTFTYYNFGAHLLFILSLTALFRYNVFTFSLLLAVLTTACIWYANKNRSYYFMLIGILYGYIGVSYLFFRLLHVFEVGEVPLAMIYLTGSSFFIIQFMRDYRKKIRSYDDL